MSCNQKRCGWSVTFPGLLVLCQAAGTAAQVDNCITMEQSTCAQNPSGCIVLTFAGTQSIAVNANSATEDLGCEVIAGMANESCAGDTGHSLWWRIEAQSSRLKRAKPAL